MPADDLAGQAARLREDIATFSEEVAALDQKLGDAQQRINRTVRSTRRMVIGLVVSLALDLGLTGMVTWNAYRLAAVQERTSNEVLCPLYQLFLDSYHPERQPPERLAEYERSFEVLRESRRVLECG